MTGDSIYLNAEEVAVRFRTTKWTVRRWIEAGKLPAIRVGRRWLIPTEAVETLEREQITPETGPDRHQTYRLTRGPVPRYDYFERPMSESEALRLAFTLLKVIEAGGWPQSTFRLRTQGLQAIITGRKPAPAAFWRYLGDGVDKLRSHQTVREDTSEEIAEGLLEMGKTSRREEGTGRGKR